MRTVNKIEDIKQVQLEIDADLTKSNEKLMKFNELQNKAESTLSRTKRHLDYFKTSFCADKVAIGLVMCILLTLAAIIFVLTL